MKQTQSYLEGPSLGDEAGAGSPSRVTVVSTPAKAATDLSSKGITAFTLRSWFYPVNVYPHGLYQAISI